MMKRIYANIEFTDPSLSWEKHIGWLNGEPVAASTLVKAGGVAVSYDESILPNYKGWGIEDAINITPLKLARDAGYKVGLIPTTVGGIKRFTQLGFEELFKFKKFVDMSSMRRRRRRRRR